MIYLLTITGSDIIITMHPFTHTDAGAHCTVGINPIKLFFWSFVAVVVVFQFGWSSHDTTSVLRVEFWLLAAASNQMLFPGCSIFQFTHTHSHTQIARFQNYLWSLINLRLLMGFSPLQCLYASRCGCCCRFFSIGLLQVHYMAVVVLFVLFIFNVQLCRSTSSKKNGSISNQSIKYCTMYIHTMAMATVTILRTGFSQTRMQACMRVDHVGHKHNKMMEKSDYQTKAPCAFRHSLSRSFSRLANGECLRVSFFLSWLGSLLENWQRRFSSINCNSHSMRLSFFAKWHSVFFLVPSLFYLLKWY